MFSNQPNDALDALLMAECIDAMYSSQRMNEVLGVLANDVPNPTVNNINLATRNRLTAGYIGTASDSYIFVDGCRRADTARDLVYSYALPPNENPGLGENVVLANLAIQSFAGLVPNGLPPSQRVTIAGYSAGAAVALFLGASLAALRPDLQLAVFAFNPPRPAIRAYQRNHRSVRYFRWHCKFDPIAHLPLWSSESPNAARLTDPVTVGRVDEYTQIGEGVQIDEDGNLGLLGAGDSGDLDANPALNLLGWGVGALNDPVVAHSLPEVIRRIRVFLARPDVRAASQLLVRFGLPTSGSGFRAPAPPDYVGPHSQRQEFNRGHRMEDIAAAIIPQAMRQPLKHPVNAPRRPFYAQKIFGKWFVVYLGTPCFDAGGRRKAKGEAAKLNAISARMADEDVANKDQPALSSAFDYETKTVTQLIDEGF